MEKMIPKHYGGKDNPFETIKVLAMWGMDKDFYIGNVVKYIARSGKKANATKREDLVKSLTYLDMKMTALKNIGYEGRMFTPLLCRNNVPRAFFATSLQEAWNLDDGLTEVLGLVIKGWQGNDRTDIAYTPAIKKLEAYIKKLKK